MRRRARLWPAVVAGVVMLPVAAGAGEVGRYRFSCRADGGTFVLDTEPGRVWRFDRIDDAWYLYDLEALVGRRARGRHEDAPPPPEPPADAPER